MEIIAIGVLAAIAGVAVIGRGRRPALRYLLVAMAAAVLTAGASTLRSSIIGAPSPIALPADRRDRGYVSSDTCRSCHPNEYASWHRSFHRTMTQAATPETVLADFNDVTLSSWDRTYRLERRGDEFWAEMVDPHRDFEIENKMRRAVPGETPPRTWNRVMMITGSHHMQTFWVGGADGKAYRTLPFLWLNEQRRWIPRESGFIRHVSAGRMVPEWNSECIKCHSTAPKPGFDLKTQQVHSAVGELGIACEACHGPAEKHVQANASPLRRYELHWQSDRLDSTIVNPKALPAQESSQVCGQCHGIYRPLDPVDFSANGYRYQPGGDVDEGRHYLRHPASVKRTGRAVTESADAALLKKYFWPDGTVRVTGREYTAMTESGCYLRGNLSCLSCHSMHRSDPEDQLGERMGSDDACFQCHESYRTDVAKHTHHKAGSSGSACYNCHMPHTAYGLLKAVRNHLIDSPTTADLIEQGRPNACNLCHLDRSLEWTAEHLVEWYQQPAPAAPFAEEQRGISAAVLWLLRGDAGQRALIAWSMRWDAAREASGDDWFAPYLAHLLLDPYSAVRYIAGESLRSLSDDLQPDADFLESTAARTLARDRILAAWSARPFRASRTSTPSPETRDASTASVLIDADRGLHAETIDRLLRQRDDTLEYLSE